MTQELEKLIAKYNKQWNKYGMGSVIAYSQVVADLEKLKEMEKEQQNNLPIHIHEGISNTHVYIEDGVVNVKPNKTFKQQEQ